MSSLSGKTVLIADDEPELREVIQEELASLGADIVVAASGNQAIEQLRQRPVDVVVSDGRMADGDGIDLLKFVKAQPEPHPVFILISGQAQQDLETFRKMGADGIFAKPFNIDSVVGHILLKMKK